MPGWHFFTGPINWLLILCTILAFVIPFAIYKINNWLHQYGDPIWKQENRENE